MTRSVSLDGVATPLRGIASERALARSAGEAMRTFLADRVRVSRGRVERSGQSVLTAWGANMGGSADDRRRTVLQFCFDYFDFTGLRDLFENSPTQSYEQVHESLANAALCAHEVAGQVLTRLSLDPLRVKDLGVQSRVAWLEQRAAVPGASSTRTNTPKMKA